MLLLYIYIIIRTENKNKRKAEVNKSTLAKIVLDKRKRRYVKLFEILMKTGQQIINKLLTLLAFFVNSNLSRFKVELQFFVQVSI